MNENPWLESEIEKIKKEERLYKNKLKKEDQKIMNTRYFWLMTLLLMFILTVTLTSCTYNISLIHTQGEATDIMDTTQNQNPDVSPTLSVPATGLGL
jgi:hypothetical protein